jgi:hypothetical protein
MIPMVIASRNHDRQRVDANLAHLLGDGAQPHRLAAAPADCGKVQALHEQHRGVADADQRMRGRAAEILQRSR